MEERGAFPAWFGRLWWVLLPGVVVVAVGMLGTTGYLLSDATRDRATGLGGVAGSGAELLVSWLLVSLILMHLWFFVAAGFAVRRNAYLARWEKWKLAGTVLVLLAVYSPVIAAVVTHIL